MGMGVSHDFLRWLSSLIALILGNEESRYYESFE